MKNIRKLKSGFRVEFTYHKKHYSFGLFETIQEAIECRDNEKKKLIGESTNTHWRKTRDYRIWVANCIRRDKVCLICGSRQQRQVHHILDGSNHPKTRFDISNGVTLCRKCHTTFHCDFKNSFREKTSKKDWDNFISLIKYFKDKTLIMKGL